MPYKQFIVKLSFIVIGIALLSNCKSLINKKFNTECESVVDLLFFAENENSIENKYAITKEFSEEKIFVLKYKGAVFFDGNDALKDYLYEGFKGRYLFITPMEKRNNLASPFLTKRDSVFLFDTKNKNLYNFNADNFKIQAFKNKYATINLETINKLKKEGFSLNATYDSVNIETKKLFLLLYDLQTIEVIELNLIK